VDRIRDAYPEATYARMAEVKRKYDPDNLFQFNQNISPKS
jgi:FAD/FMN-containing dehydrogenase